MASLPETYPTANGLIVIWENSRFGTITEHASNVREKTIISLDRNALGEWRVNIRTCGVLTHSSGPYAERFENQARKRFEDIVVCHEMGWPIDGNV